MVSIPPNIPPQNYESNSGVPEALKLVLQDFSTSTLQPLKELFDKVDPGIPMSPEQQKEFIPNAKNFVERWNSLIEPELSYYAKSFPEVQKVYLDLRGISEIFPKVIEEPELPIQDFAGQYWKENFDNAVYDINQLLK